MMLLDILTTGFQVVTIVISILIYCVMLFDIRWYFPILIIISLVPSIALKQKKNKEKILVSQEICFQRKGKKIIFLMLYSKDNMLKILNC